MPDSPEVKKLDTLAKGQAEQANTLDKINQSIINQTKILSTPPKKDVEAIKEADAKQSKFFESLKGIIASAVGGTGDAAKATGGMLAKFLKIGLSAIIFPFLGLIGAIAGVISGIMATPEARFLVSILKTIGGAALSFVKFMGSIGRWMLNLLPGGKLGTGLFKVFGSLGKTMSGLFSGWTARIAGFLEHPKIVAVMSKVSKFIKPFARIFIWLFSAVEFMKGWGKADEVFNKGEGEATIIEKFASGIGGIIDFLTFGLLDSEKAAHALKATFEFFKLAVTKPKEAWQKIVDWWKDFSFNDSVVEPMLKMFEDFPKLVREFIDGPLSNFGSMATTMLKNFIFGKKDPNAEEGDAKSGGLWGGIKSLFSAENVVKAIKGFAKITAGWYKMIGSLVSIIFIGTQGNWTDLKSWGGLFGWIKDDLFNWDNIVGVVKAYLNIWKSIGQWLGDIAGSLIKSLFEWLKEVIAKYDIVGMLKRNIPFYSALFGDKDPLAEREEKKQKLQAKIAEEKAKPAAGSTSWYSSTDERDDKDIAEWEAELAKMDAERQARMRKPITDPLAKSGLVNMSKGNTRLSSWTGQSADAKQKMNVLGGMFKGGVRVTSGYRDPKAGDKAMLGSKDSLRKYKSKWRDLLTDEELDAAAGSEARERGIAKMRAGGFASEHEHGNALDFSYPAGFSPSNFPQLEKQILDTFPGANLIKESDHLHMAFNRKNTGMQIAQLEQTRSALNRTGGGKSGDTNTQVTVGGSNSQNFATTNPTGDDNRVQEEKVGYG